MKISTKITGVFLALTLLLAGRDYLIGSLNEAVKNDTKRLVEIELVELESQIKLKDELQKLELDLHRILLNQKEQEFREVEPQKIKTKFRQILKQIDNNLQNREKQLQNLKRVKNPNKFVRNQIEDEIEEAEALTQLKERIEKYDLLLSQYLKFLERNEIPSARKLLLTELKPKIEREINQLSVKDRDISSEAEELNKKIDDILERVNQNQTTLYSASSLAVIFSLLLGIYLSKALVKPINKLKESALQVAEGNLNFKIDINSQDEIGELARCFQQMVVGLKESTVSKFYLARILAAMSDSLIVIDLEGNIQTVNSATCELLGYSEAELVERKIQRLLIESAWWSGSLSQKDLRENYETKYITKAGKLIPIIFSSSFIYNKSNSPCGLVCIAKELRKTNKDSTKPDDKIVKLVDRISHKLKAKEVRRRKDEEVVAGVQSGA